MAVDARVVNSRKPHSDYQYSLSAIENAWSSIASTKEKLDFVDRRIRNATNIYVDDLPGDPRQNQGTSKFVRKYSRRNAGNRVKIDPNPKIGFTEAADKDFNPSETEDYDNKFVKGKFKRYLTSMKPGESAHSRDLQLHDERYSTTAKNDIANEFNYEANDGLFYERPITPKVPRLDSSTDRKSLLSNIKDSGAIERIRKKIKQQKESLSSPEMQALPPKPRHTEGDHVVLNDDKPKGPMKRKVVSSTHAPSYKGFNIPEAKENVAQIIKNAESQNRKISTHKERKERVGTCYPMGKPGTRAINQESRHAKKEPKRSPGKMQRIISHRKPIPSITASSWRVGQEAVKKVLKSMKESKKHISPAKEEVDDQIGRSGKRGSERDGNESDHDSEGMGQSKESEAQTTERSDGGKSDSPTSGRTQEEFPQSEKHDDSEDDAEEDSKESSDKVNDLKKISKDLYENKDLPKEAKSMLADLQLDPSDSEEVSKPPLRDVVKSPGIKKRVKRKAFQTKLKEEDAKASQPKIRHYDQEEIQNYMAKQLAERKKKRLQERRREKQMKLEQERKLKELYIKQKSSVRSSLSARNSKTLGSTFTKPTKMEERFQSSQDKIRQETAIRKLMEEGGVSPYDSTTQHQDIDDPELPSSPPAGESSKREHSVGVELDESIENDGIEDQFKDSLEFDKFEVPGIRNITVTKVGGRSPLEAKSPKSRELKDVHTLEKSIETEVQELLAKYKASIPIELKSTEAKSQREVKPTSGIAGHNIMSKAERIAAISATATTLRERLAAEADRLASLRMVSNKEDAPAFSSTSFASNMQSTEFRGALPGTGNMHDQAKTNEEIASRERAATKIQAAFRGHSIRQGLTWKLPSGKTFGASLRDMRQKAADAASYKKELDVQADLHTADSYTTSFDPESDADLFSDRTSTESLIKDVEKPYLPRDRALPKFESLQNRPSRATPQYEDPLEAIFGRTEKQKGDQYSMINILARRLRDANKGERGRADAGMHFREDIAIKSGYMSNEELYEQDFEDGDYDSSSSTIKSDLQATDEGDGEPWEKDSQIISRSIDEQSSLNVRSKDLEGNKEEDPDKTLTQLPEVLPKDDEPSVKVQSFQSDDDVSGKSSSVATSPPRSRIVKGRSVDNEKESMSSSLRTTEVDRDERHRSDQDTTVTEASTTTEKFSPSTLERKLRAEVNQLETMDDALRQVTDIERVRGVSLAQQESVSLAQILKARQIGYKQELEQMSKDAAEKAIKDAKEIERANATATQASENAAKKLAEIRAEAAEVVAESTRKLEEVQKEAAKRTEEAADKVEKAHRMTADVAVESANRYSTDIQTMATAAASAAASSAVQAAMQLHREQLEKLRNEALKKVSRSYSQSPDSSTSTHSESTTTKSTSDISSEKKKSKITETSSYADDFEEATDRKSSILENISKENTIATDKSLLKLKKDSPSVEKSSINEEAYLEEMIADSIREEIDGSKADETVDSSKIAIESRPGKHSTPVKQGSKLKSGIEDFLQQSEIEERSFRIDDRVTSSLTEDELDDGFRMVLPVMSHRKKNLDRQRRSRREKVSSDNGTSSDELKHDQRSASKHGKHSPFAGEDTFGQFTNDLVKQYIQEEEIRSKHQRALLKLREKALLEKAKAEMAWLEMQKSSLRNKGADDLMPPLNKKQRGLWLRLQSEQNEIRRLRQAYRAASHERRLMLYQQDEIVRLKEETQKIWSKLGREKAAKSHESVLEENSDHKSISDASSIASVSQSSAASLDASSKQASASIISRSQKTASYSFKKMPSSPGRPLKQDSNTSISRTEVPEEIPTTQQHSPDTKDPSFPTYSGGNMSLRDSRVESSKRQEVEEGESTADEVSMTEHTQSSMVVDLKKLAKKSSEQYLMKRERLLQERRSKFESILNNQLGIVNKQKRIEMEELRLKSDIKLALDKLSAKAAAPLSADRSSREDASESSESTIKSQKNSVASLTSSTKSNISRDKSSGSESSVIEDIKTASNVTGDVVDESIVSEVAHKTPSTSISEEYADDTFDSPSGTSSKSISYHPDNALTSSSRTLSKKRYTKDSDESKSEEDASLVDATSDASDIEKRIRQLEEELLKRRRDLDRIRKKREKDQLRKQEQKLKKELKAVENLIQQENVSNERSSSESTSFRKTPVSPKIMSPKVLHPANQHDHLVKKQTKHPKPLSDAKETSKRNQHGLDISLQTKRDAELEVQATSKAIEQIEEKSDNEGSVSRSSLSDEVRALRKISQRSSDGTNKPEKPAETVAVDLEKSKEGNDFEKIIVSNSLLEKSISASLSQDVSFKSNRSKLVDLDRSTSSIHSESPILDRSNEAASHDKTPSKSIKEEVSKIAGSVKSSHKDGSLVYELDHDYRSDTLHSVSENIISEKSIEEKISGGRSVPMVSDSKSDQSVDDIYNDDFFESASSTRSLKSKENKAADKENRTTDKENHLDEALEQISSLKDVSDEQKSVIPDSSTPTAGDIGEGVSEALSKYESFSINDRVLIDGLLKGTLRYIGRTSFSPVAVAGIELDEGVGNTDGKFRDKRYFSCLPDYGLFSPFANISHLEGKDDLDQKEDKREGKDTRTSNSMGESVETDIEEDLIEESRLSEDIKEERESQGSMKDDLTDHSQISEALSVDQKEESYSRNKEFSYNEDFEDDEKPASSRELSYNDDFEDISSKEKQSVSQRSLSKIDSSISHGIEEASKGRPLELAASPDDIESKDKGHKDKLQLAFDDFQSSLKKDLSVASPTTLSEVGSSDTEIVPHPPRLDLDELADSLTERLLKTLMAESVEITKECIGQTRVKDTDDVNVPSSSHKGYVTQDVRDVQTEYNEEEESADEISKEIVESASEKWKYLNSAVSGQTSNINVDLEVSEAFISPVVGDVSKPNEKELPVPSLLEEDDMFELDEVAKKTSRSVKGALRSNEKHRQISPSISVTESEIENVSRALMQEAISQMILVAKEKNVKLSSNRDFISTEKSDYDAVQEKQNVEEKRGSDFKELLGELPKLSKTPPKSPTELDLGANQSTIDTDLLAAKLSELKRMDQEIDVLLGEDSDDEEQFSSLNNQTLPSTDQKPDIISPGRVFDFSEPLVHVPNTQNDISNLVADSAQIILASVANGENYDSIQPDETFLLNDIESTDGDVEVSSKTLFRRMVFDVTRDLMKEVSEFKNFQTAAKQPWTKSNRRVFAKFVRQIHTLTGSELMESFQDHVCVCLGLKEGRPSLELLKKRLPLNTSKKDYVDALLVEELREEEPNWVNYDEDEIHVKEQITEGILENLLSETVDILRDSKLMRVH